MYAHIYFIYIYIILSDTSITLVMSKLSEGYLLASTTHHGMQW